MGMIKQGVRHGRKIRAGEVRQLAEQPFRLLLIGADEVERVALARFFIPETLSRPQRERALRHIASRPRAEEPGPEIAVLTPAAAYQPVLVASLPEGAPVILDPQHPEAGLEQLLKEYPELRLALGQAFPDLRERIARALIQACAMRNATVAAISALPEVIPSPLSVVWAFGELASDSIVLTANQMRLAFELAALEGAEVGWMAQRGQMVSIVAGAFGWRALARQLVSLIPGGVGVVTKAGIAYSGTWTVGASLWNLHRRRRGVAGVEKPLLKTAARSV